MGTWIWFLTTGLLLFWGMVAPSSAEQFVESASLVLMRPVLVIQNGLAAGIAYLRGVLEAIRGEMGGPKAVLGALVQLLVCALLMVAAFYVTTLTIAGIFGQDVNISLPASFELLTGLALVVGLAYLIAVLLELAGLNHFGTWQGLSPGLRKGIISVVVFLIILGMATAVCLGIARTQLDSITIADITGALSAEYETRSTLPLAVLVLLPLFVDLTAAVAFYGAIRGKMVLFALLVWTTQVLLNVVNALPTIAYQMLDALRGMLLDFFRFLAQIGDALGIQIDRADTPQQAVAADDRGPDTQQPGSTNDGGQNQNNVQEQQDDGGVANVPPPEPELTPIEAEHLDPLGISNNHLTTQDNR